MAASIHVIADLTTVQTSGFSATTLANALNPSNKIMDMPGNLQACIVGFYDTKRRLTELQTNIDAGDAANLALVNSVLLTLS